MTSTASSAEVRASVRKSAGGNGSTPRPEGEQAAGHGVIDAEASPAALVNPALAGTPTTPASLPWPPTNTDARTPAEDVSPSGTDEDAPIVLPVDVVPYDIVRASCKLILLDRPAPKRAGETLISLAYAMGPARCGPTADSALHDLRETGSIESAETLAAALGDAVCKLPVKPERARVARRLEQRSTRQGASMRQQLHDLAGALRDLDDAELRAHLMQLAVPPLPDPHAALRQQLYDTRRMAARAANACVRALWRAEGEALDAWRQAHPDQRFVAAQWPDLTNSKNEGAINLYKLVRKLCPELSAGAVAAQISHTVAVKWKQVRWKALVQEECAPPHYRNTGTFSVRAAEVKITAAEGGVQLSFPLREGRNQRHVVHVAARDEHTAYILNQIATGAYKHGTLSIEEDRKGRGRWFVRIAYKRLVEPAKSLRYCAINRGMRAFLVAVDDAGATYRERGDDIEATLKSLQKERRSYQAQSHGSNRWGHGRVRTLRPIERLQAKGERWRQTRNQTIARQFGRWCMEQGIGMVFIEDFSGIRAGEPPSGNEWIWQRIQEWPCYQLQMRIQSVLEELGIRYKVVSAQFISQTCPACGQTEPDHRDLKRWRLSCNHCDYSRDLDVAACGNVLRRGRESVVNDEVPSGTRQRPKQRPKRAKPTRRGKR
jgi:hypothetical protein